MSVGEPATSIWIPFGKKQVEEEGGGGRWRKKFEEAGGGRSLRKQEAEEVGGIKKIQ